RRGDPDRQPRLQPARRRPARRPRPEGGRTMSALLEVEDLKVRFPTRTGVVEAVRGISFTLGRERLGIVGESGSGKSQTGRAIMGLTPANAEISAARLEFDGIDLLRAPPRLRRDLRGNRVAMILQDPKYSLNPVMSIGRQI